MLHNDSVDKVVTRYFATLTREPFTYKGVAYVPKALRVSPLLLRGYTCPPSCGGCCHHRFTLDYLPSEDRPEGCVRRQVEFNWRSLNVYTDWQEENTTRHCRHLRMHDGRCGIYEVRPFSCDFELIRTLQNEDDDRANTLTQKLFGRGWSYTRTDGGKGALCEMTPPTEETVKEVLRKLRRLEEWADHFVLKTWTPQIIHAIEAGWFSGGKVIVFRNDQPSGFAAAVR